jgi:hypothetical protein
MHFGAETEPFSSALRHAASSPDLPRRARAAIKAIALYRTRNGIRTVTRTERRVQALIPLMRSGAADLDTLMGLAREVLTSDEG